MIAITGANGLLGSFLVKKFTEEKLSVTAVIRSNSDLSLLSRSKEFISRTADVLDMPSLLEALTGVQTVVHAAGRVSFNPKERDEVIKTNVEGTANVVNACIKLGIPKLIHISSVAALGRNKGQHNVSEESKWTASAVNTHYAESKYLSELEAFRGMEEGLIVSVVNPSVILAPVKSGQSSAQLFTYVEKGWGFYGEGMMNYVDVRDVATMVLELYRGNHNGERFIANAGVVSLKELLDAIAVRMGKKKPGIKIPSSVAWSAALLEEWRAELFSKQPFLTRQSIKILEEDFFFQNEKAKKKLGMEFQSLKTTLDWCCREFLSPAE